MKGQGKGILDMMGEGMKDEIQKILMDLHDRGDPKKVKFDKNKGVEGWLLTSYQNSQICSIKASKQASKSDNAN